MNQKHHKTRKFLKIPRISGGKEELRNFLKENLKYPTEALENRVQGDVIVRFKIKDTGEILDPEIIKSLGYGCDEEAIRLIRMLQYDPVKNRGARVTAQNKLKIPFRLPPEKPRQKISIQYTPAKKETSTKEETPQKKEKPATYSYTIKLQ